ncbi:MAG: RNA polymerase factor sigma-54 [Proteobacteria bacterium]|nr:RNA polymerase factor sigma-54 [Pseudomonadota bacterium]
MKQGLSTQLGQQLTLTPALRQAIHLLSLSTAELESEINRALESNPLLERADEDDAPPATATAHDEATASAEPAADAAGESQADIAPSGDEPDWEFADLHGSRNSGSMDGDDSAPEPAQAPDSLQDHLLWQLHLTPLSPRERAIGAAVIEAVGEDGYLSESLADIRAGLRPEIDAGDSEIATVLHRIQRFDPVGVACTSLAECLSVQLSMLAPETPGLALARRLVGGHLEALARQGTDALARLLGSTAEAAEEAAALVRSLDPRPGGQIASGAPEYVQPDCVAYRHDGLWKVALVHGNLPALAISRHYESLIATARHDDARYLRGHLQEARWLIRSLATRADTVLRVAQAIVRQQAGFLDYGAEAMRPLTLRELAEELDLHESTISRTTTRKYLHTPRGTFEFKHFFASGIATEVGGTASSTAIQAMIKRLVEAEDPRKPLSDAVLAEQLKGAGIPVARRTVAKYREALRIAPSHERMRR